uniref:Uncharacterized protein n=2 Tax=Canis lupus familiaris TaxID=9615 RepID=A0A8C0SWA9_CANLF
GTEGEADFLRSRKHQDMFSFKNDKCHKSDQTKKINANLHNGEGQHCKEVLLQELAKHSKYKPFQKFFKKQKPHKNPNTVKS